MYGKPNKINMAQKQLDVSNRPSFNVVVDEDGFSSRANTGTDFGEHNNRFVTMKELAVVITILERMINNINMLAIQTSILFKKLEETQGLVSKALYNMDKVNSNCRCVLNYELGKPSKDAPFNKTDTTRTTRLDLQVSIPTLD